MLWYNQYVSLAQIHHRQDHSQRDAHHSGITNMYLSHKYTILQMMHVSGHKTQMTFMDYIKLSSEEIADEIAAMSKKENDIW